MLDLNSTFKSKTITAIPEYFVIINGRGSQPFSNWFEYGWNKIVSLGWETLA